MQTSDTRERILSQMYLDIRRNGFQGLRADKVLAGMDITKGALYHYFPSKQAIGVAVIDEIIRPRYLYFYRELDRWEGHPVDKLLEHLHFLAENATEEEVSLGCPLNNLVQEMSPLDEDFRLRMKVIVDNIHASVAAALARGQAAGQVKTRFNPEQVAQFFFANIEGAYSMAKVRRDAGLFRSNMDMLAQFLNSLRV
jgi:TetR/AcrR family transcriptional regulator, transcriptional repressor for nem operon